MKVCCGASLGTPEGVTFSQSLPKVQPHDKFPRVPKKNPSKSHAKKLVTTSPDTGIAYMGIFHVGIAYVGDSYVGNRPIPV